MSLLTKKKYSFISRGMDKKTFTVVSFKGFEAISKPYRFEILLVSEKTDIDPLAVLQNPATFTIHRDEEDDVDFNGILMQFEETQEFDDHLFFKAILTPKFWWLSLTHHNQVFLDLSVPEIMEQALKDGGLNPGVDFAFNLINSYDPHEYICQYDESHFNFVSRWAEREGIYYFFEQTPAGEKIIFTDSKMEHKDLLLGKDLIYLPQSGLDALHTKEVVQNFICRHNMLPQKVFLKDYNYLKPSFSIEGMADVDPDGRGENYVYGVHFDTPEDGNRLAKIRAEALICRKSIFHGESSVPFIVPGYTFDLNDHYKDAYNRKYLVSEVTHEGHQTGYLIAGLSKALEEKTEAMFYSNTFTAIYSNEQFRAEHLSEKPKISGTINAKIDAASSGEYAELDEHGRYKVILPFDRSGRFGGKASAYFRMMQPSAGQNQGMHFPLHKGTEVLLTFIDGNPDRPVIAGAMPNPETASPVTGENQTKSVISTGKNPVDGSVGAAQAFGIDTKGEWSNPQTDNFIEFEDAAGSEHIYIHSNGDIRSRSEKKTRIHAEDDLWTEAQNRYVEYKTGVPSNSESRPDHVAGLIETISTHSSTGFGPTGAKLYSSGEPYEDKNNPFPESGTDGDKWAYLVDRGKVTIAKGDTFNTQEGNIYDFGGYWNYNLGNSYEEAFIKQNASGEDGKGAAKLPTLNGKFERMWPAEDKLLGAGGRIAGGIIKGVAGGLAAGLVGEAVMGIQQGFTEVAKQRSVGDCMEKGGPQEGSEEKKIKTAYNRVQDLTTSNTWVEKKFGNSYSYYEGDQISITHGNTEEHIRGAQYEFKFGVATEETKYAGNGLKTYWSKSGGGKSEEKKWDRTTGEILSYSMSHSGYFSFSTKFPKSWPELNISIDNDYNLKTSISTNYATKLSLDISFNADIDIKTGLGMGIDLDLRAGGSFKLNSSGKLEFNGMGFTGRIEAAIKAKKAAIEAESKEITINNILVQLSKNSAKIEKNSIDLATNELRMQMGFELAGL